MASFGQRFLHITEKVVNKKGGGSKKGSVRGRETRFFFLVGLIGVIVSLVQSGGSVVQLNANKYDT